MLHWFGIEGDFYVMVLELLGPNLYDLFKFCGKKFTIKTTTMLAIEMIHALEIFHKHYFIHRDIKPENFMIGRETNSSKIYLIDFGLAKRYVDTKTGNHIKNKTKDQFSIGTANYMSRNATLKNESSRRDDLESVSLILLHFAKGKLPW